MSETSPTALGEKLHINTAFGLAESILRSLPETRASSDMFVKWFLAGVGALFVVMLGNIASNTRILSADGFRQCLMLLVVALLFGVLSAYKGLDAEIRTIINCAINGEKARDKARAITKEDVRAAFRLVANSQPFVSRSAARIRFYFATRKMDRKKERSGEDCQLDQLNPLALAAASVFMQRWYAAWMIAASIGFAVDVGWWITWPT